MNKLPRKFEIAKAASMASNAKVSKRIGAAMFSGAVLLSVGANEYRKTHPNAAPLHNLHAEHRCILRRRHRENGRNLHIYIYRETSDGLCACSRPCNNCIRLLREAGVGRAYYFDTDGNIMTLKIS